MRKAGSGNIGATNVARVAGPLPGILTLVLDGVKGAAAVWLAARFSNDSATWMTIAGLSALIGHCFPVWLRFRGGKGVATAAGMFLASVLACGAGRDRRLYSCRAVFALRVSGFDLGSRSDALADLFVVGATSRSAAAWSRLERSPRRCLWSTNTTRTFSDSWKGANPDSLLARARTRRVTRIAILGAGSWGTALSLVLSRSSRAHEISLWVRDAGLAEEIRCKRENVSYLPGHALPDQIRVAHELDKALSAATIVIGAMPSAHAREVYSAAAGRVAPYTAVVSATKGLEPATHARMSEVIAQSLPAAYAPRLAVLSGPSFALEVARGFSPTAVVLASHDAALASELQEEFAAPNFRLYTNDDVLGVELAGAMKNVIAIAAGTCQGLGARLELARSADHTRTGGDVPPRIRLGRATRDTERARGTGRSGAHMHRLAEPQPSRRHGAGKGPLAGRNHRQACMELRKEWARRPRCWRWLANITSSYPSPRRLKRSCIMGSPRERRFAKLWKGHNGKSSGRRV